MNELVGNDHLGVRGNNPEISLGGRLLRGLLESGDWYLVNGLGQEVFEGGPFTRKGKGSHTQKKSASIWNFSKRP